jgi:hypothetical protein
MLTALGIGLLIVVIRDVFHELFAPEASGSLSRFLTHWFWRVIRRIGRHYRPVMHHAGPLMLVVVGATWELLLGVGGALIYVSRLPTAFNVDPRLPPYAAQGFMTAMYVSFGLLTTVGVSDITPETPTMRLVGLLESIFGLVLVTAWITWVLSIYPVIATRRAFVRQVSALRRAQPSAELLARETPREAATDLLRSLTEQMTKISSDLAQARITYYLQNESPDLLLAGQLPYVLALARAAEQTDGEPLVRHQGSALRLALDDFLADVGQQYLNLRDASTDTIIRALQKDHLLQSDAS